MAQYEKFEFTVSGQEVEPSTVRLGDLLDLLRILQSAILATAGGKSRSHHLSLIDVEKGSLNLVLESDAAVASAAKRVSEAIERRSSESLPQPAAASIRDLQKLLNARKWSGTLYNGEFRSTISSDGPVFSDPLVRGETTIFGTIMSIGGVRPTAKIGLEGSRHITAEVPSKEIARKLAPSLYREVELHGEAWWYSSSMKLSRFRITRIGDFDYTQSDPEAAFAELREKFGGAWDTIDPDEFVRQQREESPG